MTQGCGITQRKENQSSHREDESKRKAKCESDVLEGKMEFDPK